nr:unnamed protein product [Callosobruchus analis]
MEFQFLVLEEKQDFWDF